VSSSSSNNPEIAKHKLEGDAAVNLWLEGKDKWNAWVFKHPSAEVSFTGQNLESRRDQLKERIISFEGYVFPEGNVSFTGVKFGDGLTIFAYAKFGNGNVYFNDADFGNGEINFVGAEFGRGDVSFSSIYFEDGNVSFTQAKFGDGKVSFFNSRFGEGKVFFNEAEFGEGDVDFSDVAFGDGSVSFSKVKFGKGDYSFEKAHFGGNVFFSSIPAASALKSLSFKYAVFDKTLDITDSNFSTIIDLTHTKLSNQVLLDGLKCKLNRQRTKPFYLNKCSEERAPEKLRRLKEIATNNKANQQALHFYADEMRAKRWGKISIPSSILDLLYSISCNYGQSIARPTVLFLAMVIVVTSKVALSSPLLNEKACSSNAKYAQIWGRSLELTLANSVPFVATSKQVRESNFKEIYCFDSSGGATKCNVPGWYSSLILVQGVVSFISLFLIGLGFRNRFRV